jgi:hypothetical protein
MAVIFCKLDANLESCTSIKAKIVKIDAIIAVLYETALKSVAKGDTVEYSLDDGQVKINKTFASTESVINAIKGYESIRTMLSNKLVPRVVRLMDSKNFR